MVESVSFSSALIDKNKELLITCGEGQILCASPHKTPRDDVFERLPITNEKIYGVVEVNSNNRCQVRWPELSLHTEENRQE